MNRHIGERGHKMKRSSYWVRLGDVAVDCSKISAFRKVVATSEGFQMELLIEGASLKLHILHEDAEQLEAYCSISIGSLADAHRSRPKRINAATLARANLPR
ncbi:hypothetical protein [Duganella sp. S19_KUP01_CR8]|uniref:hypothetical protein n=1 Tax=Duganella sp. S19_KUP01_CR8 TaxID=3025502 RepID=UPI002FCDDE63